VDEETRPRAKDEVQWLIFEERAQAAAEWLGGLGWTPGEDVPERESSLAEPASQARGRT